jgi:hypothetical protein
MSAIGPKQTSASAPHMSAFGGKADMALCGNSLLRSLLGAKRTSLFAAHMSAFDPKRTLRLHCECPLMTRSGHLSKCGPWAQTLVLTVASVVTACTGGLRYQTGSNAEIRIWTADKGGLLSARKLGEMGAQ